MPTFWPAVSGQRHRLQRYLMAFGASAVVVAMFYVAAWAEFLAWRDAHVIAALVCACERICAAQRALALPALPCGFAVTVSAGVATYREGESANVLLQRADTALYRAKVAGSDRVEGESRASESRGDGGK